MDSYVASYYLSQAITMVSYNPLLFFQIAPSSFLNGSSRITSNNYSSSSCSSFLPSIHHRNSLHSQQHPQPHVPAFLSFLRASSADSTTPAPATPKKKGPSVAKEMAETDLYSAFWSHAQHVLEEAFGDQLASYPIPNPDEFVHKQVVLSSPGSKNSDSASSVTPPQIVTTKSYAYQTPKLRQIRTAHVLGGAKLQVLNFVMFPHLNYDLPFFGADLVSLPGGHLIAIDMQPLFHDQDYEERFSTPVRPIYEKYKDVLPWGGDIPEEAKQFFSPCFLWSRVQDTHTMKTAVFDAFKEYLNAYVDLVKNAKRVTGKQQLEQIKKRHLAYLGYRAEKDPARGMFKRFYGEEWTEEYIHGFLFDLERKLAEQVYELPN